jgi:hypothetical protein
MGLDWFEDSEIEVCILTLDHRRLPPPRFRKTLVRG